MKKADDFMSFIIEHEDIWIKSSDTLSWRQFFVESLNYDNLSVNKESYSDFRPTRLQFHLYSGTPNQTIQVKIPYANRLNRTHVKNAGVFRYVDSTKDWIRVAHTINKEEKTIEFTTDRIGVYCIFVNHYWYTSFTKRMAEEYPSWTKIRQTTESVGQQFLNYFGIELETVQDYLDWISEQKYIHTADIHMYDWIYMYQLPDIRVSDKLTFTKRTSMGSEEVPILDTLQEFFYNDLNKGGILDYQDNRFYTARKYGTLELTLTRGEETTTHILDPIHYHLWNIFDEFGLLVGVKRLHLEDNASFKERILDVFRYPSGTHDEGLTNGLARDLRLIKRITWKDDTKDCVLKNSHGKQIDIRSLRVDNQPLDESEYEVDIFGNIRIFRKNTGKSHEISFIEGIDKYQIYDKSNIDLYKMMYQEDGQATSRLRKWVEYINTFAPVMWDRFNWDEGFWDTIDESLTGLGYLPNIWDSSIDSWKDYVFESDR